MKKYIFALLISCSIFLTGCGAQSNPADDLIKMEDLSAEDIITYINDGVKEVDNAFIVPIPESTDYKKIKITPYLALTLEEGDDGLLTGIKLICYDIPDEETGYSYGFYSSLLISALSPDISDEFEDCANNATTMSWDSNDTIIKYTAIPSGASQLTFEPKSDYLASKDN